MYWVVISISSADPQLDSSKLQPSLPFKHSKYLSHNDKTVNIKSIFSPEVTLTSWNDSPTPSKATFNTHELLSYSLPSTVSIHINPHALTLDLDSISCKRSNPETEFTPKEESSQTKLSKTESIKTNLFKCGCGREFKRRDACRRHVLNKVCSTPLMPASKKRGGDHKSAQWKKRKEESF